jgi:uncharacterized membrane protein YhaH (DUF805 family)
MKYFLLALKNYAVFSGRSNRSEFWYFTLFYFIFVVLAVFLDNMLGFAFNNSPYGPIYMIFVLVTLLPNLAVTVRRLHDTDKSGWWILIGAIPFVGPIWLLVLLIVEGTKGENKYGPDPNGATITFDFESQPA